MNNDTEYKRNQIEAAIAEATGRTGGRTHAPRQDLAIRLKRLLETDRALPLPGDRSAARRQDYAFFDQPPQGQGVEVTYSPYAVFALYLAVQVMDAGLPQSEAVGFVRRIRPDLEAEHRAILNRDAEQLIDHAAPHGLEREIKLGFLVREFKNMVFLVVPASVHATALYSGKDRGLVNICRSGKQFQTAVETTAILGGPLVVIELVNVIHRLAYWLERIEPIRRGRK